MVLPSPIHMPLASLEKVTKFKVFVNKIPEILSRFQRFWLDSRDSGKIPEILARFQGFWWDSRDSSKIPEILEIPERF